MSGKQGICTENPAQLQYEKILELLKNAVPKEYLDGSFGYLGLIESISGMSKVDFAYRLQTAVYSHSRTKIRLFHEEYYKFMGCLCGAANAYDGHLHVYDAIMNRLDRYHEVSTSLWHYDSIIVPTSARYKEVLRMILVALLAEGRDQMNDRHFKRLIEKMVDHISKEEGLIALIRNIKEYYVALENPELDGMQEPSAPPEEALVGAGAGVEAVEVAVPSAPPESAMEDDAEDCQDPINIVEADPADNRVQESTRETMNSALVGISDEDSASIDEDPVNPTSIGTANEDPVAAAEASVSPAASASPMTVASEGEDPTISTDELISRLGQLNVPEESPTPFRAAQDDPQPVRREAVPA